MDTEDSITKLLRLKRYEHPPEEYFENFLAEFQVRQRAEVIHRPFLSIAWDRFSSIFVMPPVPRLVMASSFAVAVFTSVFVLDWSDEETNPNSPRTSLNLAAADPVTIDSRQNDTKPAKPLSTVHYVLPARPATYASARSF